MTDASTTGDRSNWRRTLGKGLRQLVESAIVFACYGLIIHAFVVKDVRTGMLGMIEITPIFFCSALITVLKKRRIRAAASTRPDILAKRTNFALIFLFAFLIVAVLQAAGFLVMNLWIYGPGATATVLAFGCLYCAIVAVKAAEILLPAIRKLKIETN